MIKVVDCGELLVDVKKICPDLIISLDSWRMKKEKTAYLRKTVAKMICQAKKNLPQGMTFVIRDAWRPGDVQKEIFKGFVRHFGKQHRSWSKKRIIKEVKKYVAPASGRNASGHMTGAAVDLRLMKNGRKVPMKSKKLSYQENSQSFQPKLPKYLQKNRQIMFRALKKAGLTNYSQEYWHWSYGDIQWTKRNKKKKAFYGVVKSH